MKEQPKFKVGDVVNVTGRFAYGISELRGEVKSVRMSHFGFYYVYDVACVNGVSYFRSERYLSPVEEEQ